MASKKKRKNSALAALFQGVANITSAFDAAAQTRKEKPQANGSLSGVKPTSDCGGCK